MYNINKHNNGLLILYLYLNNGLAYANKKTFIYFFQKLILLSIYFTMVHKVNNIEIYPCAAKQIAFILACRVEVAGCFLFFQ